VSIEKKSDITFPHRAVIRFDFPQRGGLPPVSVYWHDSAYPGEPEAYKVPGIDNEMILPPSNNLGEKGRGTSATRAGGPPQRRPTVPPGQRTGPGGPGVPVFGRGSFGLERQPGVLAGNGAVFMGSKGIMATVERGEGVHLLPGERWKNYTLPSQLLSRSPGHMADWVRACKGGEPSCSHFGISGPYTEWMVLGVIAFRVGGKLNWDSKNFRFTNSAEANKYVRPAFRKGWELKL
jgi:hypothetical protein